MNLRRWKPLQDDNQRRPSACCRNILCVQVRGTLMVNCSYEFWSPVNPITSPNPAYSHLQRDSIIGAVNFEWMHATRAQSIMLVPVFGHQNKHTIGYINQTGHKPSTGVKTMAIPLFPCSSPVQN
jgi:hypothetical protein